MSHSDICHPEALPLFAGTLPLLGHKDISYQVFAVLTCHVRTYSLMAHSDITIVA